MAPLLNGDFATFIIEIARICWSFLVPLIIIRQLVNRFNAALSRHIWDITIRISDIKIHIWD